MSFNEATRDMFELIKYEVVEERPEWEALDATDTYQAIFLMVAAVALKGNTYSFEMSDDEGNTELITIEPMMHEKVDGEVERAAIAISSDRANSKVEKKFAATVQLIFDVLNGADKSDATD